MSIKLLMVSIVLLLNGCNTKVIEHIENNKKKHQLSGYKKVTQKDKEMMEDIIKYNQYNSKYKPVYPNKYLKSGINSSSASTKAIREEYKKRNGNEAMNYVNHKQHNNFDNSNNQKDICDKLSISIDDKTNKISVQDKGCNIDEYKERIYKYNL